MSSELLLGRYEKQSIIGMGGMARVYKGRDTKTGNEVAIKMLRIELSDDEVFESRVLAFKMVGEQLKNVVDEDTILVEVDDLRIIIGAFHEASQILADRCVSHSYYYPRLLRLEPVKKDDV